MKKIKPTLLGYVMMIYDNKGRMNNYSTVNECDRFKDVYSINRFDPKTKIKTKKDISSTYDNYTIVSDAFKRFCEIQNYKGLEFIKLPESLGLYWFKIYNILPLDLEDHNIRFINFSQECGGYEEIIGPYPVRFKEKGPIPDGFFRSDICFGSFQNKFPLEIIGIETKNKLRDAGFKIDCSEILDIYL